MKLGQTLRLGAVVIAAAMGLVAIAGSAGAAPTISKIAYMSTFDGEADIYWMDAEGKTKFNITHDKTFGLRADVEPAWSPNGTMVAFERQYTKQHGADVMVIRADGTKLYRLSPPASSDGIWNSHPSWSPDGSMVVFTSNRDGNFELYLVKASGLGLTQLTFTKSVRNSEPQWSPDGRSIVFARNATTAIDTATPGLFVLDLWRDRVVQLTKSTTGVIDSTPSWSPDGKLIAFTSDRMGSNDIWVMHADGSNLARLTQTKSNDNHPSWAPDGRTLAFVSDRTGATEIFTFAAATEVPKQLTFDKAFKSNPTWQRGLPTTG